jgi:hypothetical protein
MKNVARIAIVAAFVVLLLGSALTPTASAWYPKYGGYGGYGGYCCNSYPTYGWGYPSYYPYYTGYSYPYYYYNPYYTGYSYPYYNPYYYSYYPTYGYNYPYYSSYSRPW